MEKTEITQQSLNELKILLTNITNKYLTERSDENIDPKITFYLNLLARVINVNKYAFEGKLVEEQNQLIEKLKRLLIQKFQNTQVLKNMILLEKEKMGINNQEDDQLLVDIQEEEDNMVQDDIISLNETIRISDQLSFLKTNV
ncbi:hypothetical protein DLAC_09376 [Tieghemostelium lacteum]|uniref:Uncharacterized protein n=1 Tax=Tieghemostelium lacteum TaxID=361077 RepID=A0A151Z9X1_TIELA|nr:hypothetical protein DLAC_09376 [Tieghemostelium lacteum]|eukprot:KYQ90739.1 hypothetical protein DLAC_09376 [Tieghemostelium lacteum]